MEIRKQLAQELENVDAELGCAEVALVEAKAETEELRERHARLRAALDALDGKVRDSSEAERRVHTPEDGVSESPPATKPKPASEPASPFAHLKCKGCGSVGQMDQQVIQAPSGMPVGMLICGNCGNQMPMGL